MKSYSLKKFKDIYNKTKNDDPMDIVDDYFNGIMGDFAVYLGLGKSNREVWTLEADVSMSPYEVKLRFNEGAPARGSLFPSDTKTRPPYKNKRWVSFKDAVLMLENDHKNLRKATNNVVSGETMNRELIAKELVKVAKDLVGAPTIEELRNRDKIEKMAYNIIDSVGGFGFQWLDNPTMESKIKDAIKACDSLIAGLQAKAIKDLDAYGIHDSSNVKDIEKLKKSLHSLSGKVSLFEQAVAKESKGIKNDVLAFLKDVKSREKKQEKFRSKKQL